MPGNKGLLRVCACALVCAVGWLAGCNGSSNGDGPAGEVPPYLIALEVSSGIIRPAFDSLVFSYRDTVSMEVAEFEVTPRCPQFVGGIITVNGDLVPSGGASGKIPLAIGPNTIAIVVGSDGSATQRTYTLNVVRSNSPKAELSYLGVSAGGLVPDFRPSVLEYSAYWNLLGGLSITAIAVSAASTITVNGIPAVSGTATPDFPKSGVDSAAIVVAVPGGESRTYKIRFTKFTPLPVESIVSMGAQANATLGSALDLDPPRPMLAAQAQAEQEKIGLVILFYAGAYHLDNAPGAKAAALANSINYSTTWDDSRLKPLQMVRVLSPLMGVEEANRVFAAGPPMSGMAFSAGDVVLVRTATGKLAQIRGLSIIAWDPTGSFDLGIRLMDPVDPR